MLRVFLQMGFGLTLILLLPLTLIRAQAHDTAAVKALLATLHNCSQPCFMGIRPGATTLDEAKELLTNHTWFQGFDAMSGPNVIYIRWDESQSPLTNGTTLSSVSARDGIVQSVIVTTSIPFLEIWGSLGPPDWGYGRAWGGGYTGILHTVGYEENALMFQFYVPPVHWSYGRKWRHLFDQDATLFFSTREPVLTFDNPTMMEMLRGAIRLSAS